MKKGILLLGVLFLVLVVNFVSAEMCKGSDGYYHDCYSSNYNSYNKYNDNNYDRGFNYDRYEGYNRNNYRERDVVRINYNNDFVKSRNLRTYYITYDDGRSHYRTYYDDNRYGRNNNRIIYLASNSRSSKNYGNDRYSRDGYNRNKDYGYDNRQRYNYYDSSYSNRRTNYRVQLWRYERSYDCPYGWSCTDGNRVSSNRIYL